MARQALAGVSARKGADYVVRAVPNTARGMSIPAPVGGWDAISPLAAMPETNAIVLDNMFPQPGYIEIRKGHKTHHKCGGAAVESLMPYHAPDPTNDKLFAACTSAISDVTVFTTVSASSTATAVVSSLANARWQHINVANSGGNYLWICNGADKPRYYDGSAWATVELAGVSSTGPIQAALFKSKIWMTIAGQLNAAYLPTNAIQGTAAPFDLTGVFRKGGYLQAVGSWSLDGGAGPDDHIAFLTSKGEVAIYTGTDPASDFKLRGLYEMGSPLGRRCLVKVGADLLVTCLDGLLPLSKALVTDRAAAITASITKMIQPVMNASARSYGANFGWEVVPYPRGTRAILNVPVTENTLQHQYVMNTVTGAWCRFTGENGNCWGLFKDRLFYGGNNGRVFEADCQGFDEGAAIAVDVETAFNYAKSRGTQKQWTMARTLLTTDGQVNLGMALNVDFARTAVVHVPNTAQPVVAQWDVANWDEGTWPEVQRIVTDWVAVEGIGYCASIHMQANVQAGESVAEAQSLTLQINGWDTLMLDGAFL
jgi:hypothetical protein